MKKDAKKRLDAELAQANEEHRKYDFPVEVFPSKIQKIVAELYDKSNFPKEYTGACTLNVVSVATGGLVAIKVKEGFTVKGNRYDMLISPPGTYKTPVIDFCFARIKKLQYEAHKKYLKEKKQYEKEYSNAVRNDDAVAIAQLEEPSYKQRIAQDTTPEALFDILKKNPNGVGIVVDEMVGWISNQNRYNQDSSHIWLSIFNNNDVYINRVSKEEVFIRHPYLSLMGGIQPEVLKKAFKKISNNGMFERICITYLPDLPQTYLNENDVRSSIEKSYDEIILKLIDTEFKGEDPKLDYVFEINLSEKANNVYFAYDKKLVDMSNETDSEILQGYYSKNKSIVVKNCLLLHLLSYASGEIKDWKVDISEDTMSKAVRLTDYFISMWQRITEFLSDNELDNKTINIATFCQELPDSEFTTKEALDLKIKNPQTGQYLSKRTLKRYLQDNNYFIKISHGKYKKTQKDKRTEG